MKREEAKVPGGGNFIDLEILFFLGVKIDLVIHFLDQLFTVV